jgi:C_GCAxxG_C_C family probable redox protein
LGTKAKRAKELFKDGYNCSQAVLGAFCDDLNLDFESAMRMASSFGGGMGRLREVCGAVSGLFLAVGLKFGYSSPIDIDAKAKHYELIQQLAEKFKEKNGSIICRELLNVGENKESHIPEKRTEMYYKKRPCAELVEDAAEIFEELLMSSN